MECMFCGKGEEIPSYDRCRVSSIFKVSNELNFIGADIYCRFKNINCVVVDISYEGKNKFRAYNRVKLNPSDLCGFFKNIMNIGIEL